MFASCVLIVRLTRCAGWVPQDQLLATVNGRSQLATLWRCCSGLTTQVMRAPRPCYLFPLEAAEGNSSEHIWVFQKIWALKNMEAHKHHHPNGSRWGNQWCRCQMDTHAHCAHRSFPSGVPIGLTKGLVLPQFSGPLWGQWRIHGRPDQGVSPPVLRTIATKP
jgi:hypothetical protein